MRRVQTTNRSGRQTLPEESRPSLNRSQVSARAIFLSDSFVIICNFSDRYRHLPRFIHQPRFLITVQVPILELYHTRISESLDAFETLSSFIVRAVPGALAGQVGHGRDVKGMTAGVEGSQRLTKAFVSAKWMAGIMGSWGEDLVCHCVEDVGLS